MHALPNLFKLCFTCFAKVPNSSRYQKNKKTSFQLQSAIRYSLHRLSVIVFGFFLWTTKDKPNPDPYFPNAKQASSLSFLT